MRNSDTQILHNNRSSFRTSVMASVLAIIGAVAVPQLFHFIGAVSGLGTALGETFLPMHLPIILAGFLAGPYAGAVSGLLGPLASFLLSGMPSQAILPFMMIELCAYGFFAGVLKNVKVPTAVKVLAVQLFGRAVRAIFVLAAVYLTDIDSIKLASIWLTVKNGLFGIILQLVLIPLIVFWVNNREGKNRE